MAIKLNAKHAQTISEFCNDIAKGLMLAAFLGQIVIADRSIYVNLINLFGVIVESLIFLTIALKLRRKV